MSLNTKLSKDMTIQCKKKEKAILSSIEKFFRPQMFKDGASENKTVSSKGHDYKKSIK